VTVKMPEEAKAPKGDIKLKRTELPGLSGDILE